MVILSSDKYLTLETNSSSSPQETIALKEGNPLLWVKDAGLDLPFAGDVTKIFATNASGADAELKIRALFDATP